MKNETANNNLEDINNYLNTPKCMNLFKQLKAYFNFRNEFAELKKAGNDRFIQNQYYLIDKNWIKKMEKIYWL